MINILIADDHEIFSEALGSLLEASDGYHVIATASNGMEAVELVALHPEAHVLILDVSMPVMSGIDAVVELRRLKVGLPILMLTQEAAGGTISRALKAGAQGYVLKTAGRDEFLLAIKTVAEGGEHISAAATTSLINRLTGRKTTGEVIPLTRRELEVLRLVVHGKTTNEIAALLFISPYTAETHRRNLLQKLDLPNSAALVRYAIEQGLIDG